MLKWLNACFVISNVEIMYSQELETLNGTATIESPVYKPLQCLKKDLYGLQRDYDVDRKGT